MKKLILIVLGLVVVVVIVMVLAMTIIGSQLPVSHVVTRSVLLHRPASEIYKAIRDVDNSPGWRDDVKSVEVLGENGGHFQYREHGSQGDVTYEFVEDVPDQRVVTRIVDQDLGYSGNWVTELKGEADGTRVTITENGEVSNVLFRFLSRYVFGHTSTIDSYLTSLGKHFGETVQPQ